ncbi:MAG: hypothetical protein A2X83_01495 [Desulfuromonadales bacterium GWD2_54_10]|nr:MAG: hypothetical protein A2X83_01495 [Desulfuromonadales bacterium GWD2_54_10]
MKKIAIVILSCLALPAISFAADNMREGYWELITTTEMPGMPMKIPPAKMKHCYTKEDVKDQKRSISTDKNCTVTDLKQSGNKVTWKMKCTGQNAGVFSGETVYKADAYDSTMKMQSQGQTVNMKIKARRLGNCP